MLLYPHSISIFPKLLSLPAINFAAYSFNAHFVEKYREGFAGSLFEVPAKFIGSHVNNRCDLRYIYLLPEIY